MTKSTQFTFSLLWISIPIIFSFLTITTKFVSASEGDEREPFISCVQKCIASLSCNIDGLILRLSQWTCGADCQYRCMRDDVNNLIRKDLNGKIVQYYGKWPFIRVFGAQEIFSVIFSLGNLVANIIGYKFIYNMKARPANDKMNWMKRVHDVTIWIACNTWLQSAIFHFRDTRLTEKLDYFSACLFIMTTVPVAWIRTFKIKQLKHQIMLIVPFLAIYLHHIHHMTFTLFDYGYHTKFNLVFAVMSNCLWIRWGIILIRSKGKNQKQYLKNVVKGWQIIRFVVFNCISTALIAIDFPPFFDLIDMHAIWHLSTIPITFLWYNFIRNDDDCDI